MFSGEQIVGELNRMGITHVVWLPDSLLGTWEKALSQATTLKLIRVCREAETWAVAAGLYLGGANPLVMIQCTGLFDSGDSLRNAQRDYGLPLFSLIGYRSYLNPAAKATDSATTYTEPILKAWDIDYRLIERADQLSEISEHFEACRQAGKPGAILIGEGRM